MRIKPLLSDRLLGAALARLRCIDVLVTLEPSVSQEVGSEPWSRKETQLHFGAGNAPTLRGQVAGGARDRPLVPSDWKKAH